MSTVITYRARSAGRDAARALGYAAGQVDTWTRRIGLWQLLSALTGADTPTTAGAADGSGAGREGGVRDDAPLPEAVLDLARQFEDVPRHLGIHRQ